MQHVHRFFSRGFHCQRNLQAKFVQNQQISAEKQVVKSPDLLSLNTRKEREYSAYDTLHGIHPIKCAIAAKRRTIYQVSYRRDLADSPRIRDVLELCWKENITTKPLVKKIMTGGEGPHQNIFAQVSRLHYIHIPPENESLEMLDDTQGLSKKVWLFLYGIQDPMNFGSLIRTAYMLGVDKIFVTNRDSCALTPTVSKASSGVMELVPIYSVANAEEFLSSIKQMNWNIIGTQSKPVSDDTIPCIPVNELQSEKPSLVIFGNEGVGIPKNVMALCNHSTYIQSRTNNSMIVDSLNVSSAAAIILHSIFWGKN